MLRRLVYLLSALAVVILDRHLGLAHYAPMALILTEGFDHMTAAQTVSKGWSPAFTAITTGRFTGSSAAGVANSNTFRAKVLPSTYSTLICGFAVNPDGLSSGQDFFAFIAGTTNVLRLSTDASGHLQVRNSGGTVIAVGTTVITPGSWCYIEVKLVVGTSGSVEIHLNGTTEIAATTGNFGTSNITAVGFTRTSSVTGQAAYFDDVYVVDTTGSAPQNTFLGGPRVVTEYPNGAGAHSDWTANGAATHYGCVDETTPDDDTTYVSDLTPGHIDTYTFGDVDGGATILGVQVNVYGRKDDANTRQVAPVIRQAGTDYVGTTVTLSASYFFYSQIYNADPTGAAWTPSNFNADEIGVKEIA